MAAILRALGKDALIVNPYAIPPRLQFLAEQATLKQLDVDFERSELAAYEVLIVLDTAALAQLGDMGEVILSFPGTRVVIDHHVSGDDLGALTFKNPEAEATGRLVIEVADALGVELSPEMAQPLFAALATDTGWFRFSSTSSTTLRLAARLIDAGAQPEKLYKDLYENNTLARLRLVGRTMARIQTELNGRLIYTAIEMADFQAVDGHPADSEDIINTTLSVCGTEAAVLMVEQPSGGFKVSFRSRCGVDCAAIAAQFGGGGHRKAAGAFLEGSLDEVRTRVLDAMRAAMR